MKYNFAFKDNRLKRWFSPAIKKTSKKEYTNNFISFKKYIIKNPILLAPSLIALLTYGSIKIISFIPQNKISNFENTNYEFNNLNLEISNAVSKKENMKFQYTSFETFYKNLAPIYIFAFYLQNAIPEKVSIDEIIIDQYAYKIIAGSTDLDFLNKMVTLLVESPLVNLDTIRINEIFNEEVTSSQDEKVKTSIFKAEIKGTLKDLTLDNKLELYKESSANGLLRKLSEYKKLGALFN